MEVAEQYVGTFDLGKFLDDLDISKGFTGYVTSNRGCVVRPGPGSRGGVSTYHPPQC